jgi:hypothetical protein
MLNIEPTILTANTYFWSSASSASSRRNNEERRNSEVTKFLMGLGFVENDGWMTKGDLKVRFSYSESCNHVYKSLEIYRNGKKSNITALRKLYAN